MQRNDKLPVRVQLEAGAETVRDLAVIHGVTLEGVVLAGPERSPLAGARVDVEFAPHARVRSMGDPSPDGVPAEMLGRYWSDELRNPLSWFRVETDAQGRYRLPGLVPQGRYLVRVHPHGGHAFEQRRVETGAAGTTARAEHHLARAGSARILLRSHVSYTLSREDGDGTAYAFQPPFSHASSVLIPGLSAGRWELRAYGRGRPANTPLVASFDVRAGEETRVDALDGGDCRVAGQVLRDGQPVTGAVVWIPAAKGSHVRTDDEGRFEIRFSSAIQGFGVALLVEPPEPNAARVSQVLTGGGPGRGITPGWSWEDAVVLPEGTLDVEVLDRKGAPVSRAILDVRRLGDVPPGRPITQPCAGRADADGRVRFTGLALDGCLVTATLPGTGQVLRGFVREEPDAQSRLVLRAAAPAEVLVRVLDGDGQPRARVRVGGRFWEQGLPDDLDAGQRHTLGRVVPASGQVLTDERGEARLADLAAGSIELFASMRGGHVQETHVLEAGASITVELVLEPR